jgi:hypothetical protein
MSIDIAETEEAKHEKEFSRLVVRLKTNSYQVTRGVERIGFKISKEIIILKKKSVNYDWISDVWEDDGDFNVINLNDCEDGIYQIVACNFKTDGDGNIDDYDLKLIPYKEDRTTNGKNEIY